MKTRMLCTDCGTLAHADTLLGGSDRVELYAWLCFALPGFVYCAWRHWVRTKLCSGCGGRALVREARAAALRSGGVEAGPAIRSAGRVVSWPQALRTPRERLRAGAPGAVLVPVLMIAPGGIPILMLVAAWLAWSRRRTARLEAVRSCRAWDADGRPLNIEIA